MIEIFPGVAISSELNNDEFLLQGLQNDFFRLVILHEKPAAEDLFFKKIGTEKLFIILPLTHSLAKS